MASHIRPYGADWPDVAIALLDFARTNPWRFVVFALVVLTAGYLLLPKVTNVFRLRYRARQMGKETENGESEDSSLGMDLMSDNNLLNTIFIIALTVIVYRLLRWRFLATTHDYRVLIGGEALELASDMRVKKEIRDLLKFLSDAMYQPSVPWIMALFSIVVAFQFRPSGLVISSGNPEVAQKVRRVKLHMVFALISVSPIACLIGVGALFLGLLIDRSADVVMETISATGDASIQKLYNLRHIGVHN